jgi:peptidoglycan hydrolase flgJ
MMIQPISDASLLGAAVNSSYDAARTSAEEKSFQATLDELRRKAEAAHSSAAADPAAGYVPKNLMSDADVQAKKLREACEGFEAMFLSMMYKQMRATVPESGLFGKKSNAIKIFEDMRDTELMNAAAKSGGIGLADMMYKQLSPTVVKK